jgi:hypothetical protein
MSGSVFSIFSKSSTTLRVALIDEPWACRTYPFRNIARTKRHVAPSHTWDTDRLLPPCCSLAPLLFLSISVIAAAPPSM